MSLGKVRSVPERGYFTRLGPALLANIRLGWKGLSGTNTVAYYKYLEVKDIK